MRKLHAWLSVISLSIGVAFTLVLLVIAFKTIMQDEEDALSQKFGVIRGSLVEKISSAHEVLHSLKLQFDLSVVDADQFRILAEDALLLHPYIKSIKYFPIVSNEERAEFEKVQRTEGYSTFTISEKLDEKYIPAKRRSRYLPLIFQEPFSPEIAQSMGVDILSDSVVLPYLESAINTAKPVQAITPSEYIILKATYAGKEEARINQVEERRNLVNGIVLLVIDTQQLLLPDTLNDIQSLTLNTSTGPGSQRKTRVLDYTSIPEASGKWRIATFERSREIVMGEGHFELKITKALNWKPSHIAPLFWALLGGSVVTVLLYLLSRSVTARADNLQQRNQEIQHIVENKTQELAFERDRAQVTLNSIAEAVITTDKQGLIEYMNPVAEQLSGFLASDVIGKPIFDTLKIVVEETQEEVMSSVQLCLLSGEAVSRQDNTILMARDGRAIAINESAAPIYDMQGEISGVVLIFHDVSAMRSLTAQIYHQATHDALTGLPNRLMLKDRVEVELSRARREKQIVAVLFIDLDRFKLINDSFGHTVGDELLREAANRFTNCTRETDIVSRLGGDEFVVVMSELDDSKQAGLMAERLLKSLHNPFTHDQHEFFVGASIGISFYPESGETAEELMTNADIAMYRVKGQGKNSYLYYNEALNDKSKPRISLETELRHAIKNQELILHYQPQVDGHSGRITGFEALVRWNHPVSGMVPPNDFIPLAEETGLIEEIGCWVMTEACKQNKAWQDMGLPEITMAVNLAHRQFLKSNLISEVKRVLDETGLQARYLDIELTEGVLAENAKLASSKLLELKSLGVHLSIDDFGTGYSSLAYLKDFPIDTVKIDRCFVRDIENVKKDAEICMAIIAMTHSMNLKVVAEGVENEAQLAFLRSKDCDIIQGYYYSKPLPADAAEQYLRNNLKASTLPV